MYLVAIFPEPEGLVDTAIEVIIKVPVSGRRPEDGNPVFSGPVPVPFHDLVATLPEPEGLIDSTSRL